MVNKYPLWKNLLILVVLALGLIYSAPNLYPPDPAVQISGASSTLEVNQSLLERAGKVLKQADIAYFGEAHNGKSATLRLKTPEDQLAAKRILKESLGDDYVVALNLAPTTPDWLVSMGAGPMKYGLDLSGGIHFLMEVDTDAAVNNRVEVVRNEVAKAFRAERKSFRYRSVKIVDRTVVATFKSEQDRDLARDVVREQFPALQRSFNDVQPEQYELLVNLTESEVKEIQTYAVSQNLTTLRNRVNELGVAEPIVQKQGINRIVVELPGVQDTAEAKRILGKTASLEFRMEAETSDSIGQKETFKFRDQKSYRSPTAELKREVVISGKSVANAAAAFDENGRPQVNISLDSNGGTIMHRTTRHNVGRRLGVLFIEHKTKTTYLTDPAGKPLYDERGERQTDTHKYVEKRVISLATVQSALGTQFRITGLDSSAEASELALLLRAGALAAPIYFVEERTVGPSLGAENIELGYQSVILGLSLVLVMMLVIYRVFGLAANLALVFNMILLIACMSALSATLTLPGIAGIVLTVGMAVDANVLIFSRIREELKNGLQPQSAISSGFDRAFVTILDANLTTLIVAVILYAIGTGPVKGFAVTLSIGILTSMFTAIVGTRAIVNLMYGGRNVKKLWI